MKHRFLISATIAVSLFGFSTVATTQSQPVQAARWYVRHSPFFLSHKVKLTKRVAFKKIKSNGYTYKDRIVGTKRLKKGSVITIKKGGASYPWFVKGHGMKYGRHTFWTTYQKGKWFKVIR